MNLLCRILGHARPRQGWWGDGLYGKVLGGHVDNIGRSPSTGLLCKLASIAVHADEMLSADGHEFDRAALLSILSDSEVQAWLEEMIARALAPKRRQARNPSHAQ